MRRTGKGSERRYVVCRKRNEEMKELAFLVSKEGDTSCGIAKMLI